MDEARAVLRRLKRIETLERTGAPPGDVLAEVRELLREGEAWLEREGASCAALERCRVAYDAGAVA
jgi:hypothetical protein